MYRRDALLSLHDLLSYFPAVAILGPRQTGKTTLARSYGDARNAIYLDLENPEDRRLLADPVPFLRMQAGQLIILDEVQRVPELFPALRGLIDEGRRAGRLSGQFLILGSASRDLLRQSSEGLTGRIAFLELPPLTLSEVEPESPSQLWVRGGYPESYLAPTDALSLTWRRSYITQYLERDLPLLGIRTPAETLRRLWTMVATAHGTQLHPANLGTALGLDAKTVASHLDTLSDLMLLRRLLPWSANLGKRLVKTPKVYWRDSGVVHALLGIATYRELLSHIGLGFSWEGFVIEQLINVAGPGVRPWFFRTSAGAEIDLLLELEGGALWAIEVKHSSTPVPSKGFYNASKDVAAARRIVIHTGDRVYAGSDGTEYFPLMAAMREVRKLQRVNRPDTATAGA